MFFTIQVMLKIGKKLLNLIDNNGWDLLYERPSYLDNFRHLKVDYLRPHASGVLAKWGRGFRTRCLRSTNRHIMATASLILLHVTVYVY